MGKLQISGQQGIDAQFRLFKLVQNLFNTAAGDIFINNKIRMTGHAHASGGGLNQNVAITRRQPATHRNAELLAINYKLHDSYPGQRVAQIFVM